MPGFGGAGPGLAILSGIAKGVVEDDKRRREMEQEAIRKALMARQIQKMDEDMELAKIREERFRDTAKMNYEADMARVQQDNLEYQQDVLDENRNYDLDVDKFEQDQREYEEGKVDDELERDIDRARLYGYRMQNQELSRTLDRAASADALAENREHNRAVRSAQSIEEAGTIAQELGYDAIVGEEMWYDSHEREDDVNGWSHPKSYFELNATNQKAADINARADVTNYLNSADEWMLQHPETRLDRWEVARGFILRDRSMLLADHSSGAARITDDVDYATIERLDAILDIMKMEDQNMSYSERMDREMSQQLGDGGGFMDVGGGEEGPNSLDELIKIGGF
jgi:hypothetical protein